MKTSKFTDSQIMSILKQAESGTHVATLCREQGMSNANFEVGGEEGLDIVEEFYSDEPKSELLITVSF